MTKREETAMGKQSRKNKRRRKKKKSMAAKADRHLLYEAAVQDPAVDADTLGRFYKKFRKKEAKVFREDFCGTGLLSTTWVKAKSGRKAVGIDLDEPTLRWGQANHVDPAGSKVAQRVNLIRANVLDGAGGKADISCALNFSYQVFKKRKDLLAYFKTARRCLKSDGIFVLDVLGGPEAMGEDENLHDHGDFVYHWEQAKFDPLTHDFECHIHFEFPDGSKLPRAFSYYWRLWTVPELVDLLHEAGFSKVRRLWEKTDKKGEGTGAFYEPKEVENQDSWWTYLVAER